MTASAFVLVTLLAWSALAQLMGGAPGPAWATSLALALSLAASLVKLFPTLKKLAGWLIDRAVDAFLAQLEARPTSLPGRVAALEAARTLDHDAIGDLRTDLATHARQSREGFAELRQAIKGDTP